MSDIKRRPMPKPEVLPSGSRRRSDRIGAQRQLNEKLRQRQLYLADKRTLRIRCGREREGERVLGWARTGTEDWGLRIETGLSGPLLIYFELTHLVIFII